MQAGSFGVNWADLPSPAWLAVFSVLQQSNVLQCRLVCKTWRDLVNYTIHDAQPHNTHVIKRLHMFPLLTSLNLTKTKQLKLEHIKPFTQLTALHLPSSCEAIAPNSLAWLTTPASQPMYHKLHFPSPPPARPINLQICHFGLLQNLTCPPDLLPHLIPDPHIPFPYLTSLKCHALQTDEDLLALLPSLPYLVHLNLSLAHTLTAPTLHQISLLPSLMSLTLSSIHRLPPSLLSHLVALNHLTSLSLSTTPLDPQDVRHLSSFTALQNLDLCETCDRFPPSGLAALSHLTLLTRLNLSWCSLLPAQPADRTVLPATLRALHNLRELEMEGCDHITAAAVEALGTLSKLHRLDISQCDRMKGVAFLRLSELTALTFLKMTWDKKVTDTVLQALSSLHHLQHLDVARCPAITDLGMLALSALTSLTHLDIHRCPAVTADGIAHLTALPQLAVLDVSGCGMPISKAWPHICRMTGLEKLSLRHCHHLPSESALASITSLKHLNHLDLTSTTASASTLWPIISAPSLSTLFLRSCSSLYDSGLDLLATSPQLSVLDISDCPVSLNALRHLLRNSRVGTLRISASPNGVDFLLEAEFPYVRVVTCGATDYQGWEPSGLAMR